MNSKNLINQKGSILLVNISILLILIFVLIELIQANLTWNQSIFLMEEEEKENALFASGVAIAIDKLLQDNIIFNETILLNYNQYSFSIKYSKAIASDHLINIEIILMSLTGTMLRVEYDIENKMITNWEQISTS